MSGSMMNFQLTLPAILRRAETLFGHKEVVTRLPDKSIRRYTYADFARRTRRLAVALQKLGVQPGDRVATLGWNTYQHLEAYFAIPCIGAVLHTINPRLRVEDLTYIINHAQDRVLLIDETLLPLLAKVQDQVNIEHLVVISHATQDQAQEPEGVLLYEQLLESANEADFEYLDMDENQPAGLCYTSGTTGRPKGVLYTHRAIVLHSIVEAMPDGIDIAEADTVLPVVPMFHVNAWGLPFTCVMVGAKQVLPGPNLDPVSLLDLFEQEGVTLTAGVPTIWLGIIQTLEKEPDRWKLRPGMRMVVGGSAAPEGVIRAFDKFDLKVVHAWGMTETTPIGTVSLLSSDLQDAPEDLQYEYRAKQGRPVPLVEIRARSDEGFVPWDGKTMGELEVRGPWVASAYYNDDSPEATSKFTDDGWFRTGDVVTIDERGYVKIADRTKDLIKSGGEWISSVEMENALVGHPAVAEAAVIAVPHEKWQERPLAIVVRKAGQDVSAQELLGYLAGRFPKWWLPEEVVFAESMPHTATGKLLKSALRDQYGGHEHKA